MSTSLTLLPFAPHAEWSHTLLGPIEPTPAFEESLSLLQLKHGRDVPITFNTYLCVDDDNQPTHYGNTQHDGCGNRLKHTSVAELLELHDPARYADSWGFAESWLADAAWAYIAALPDEWRVALYWH